MAFRNMVASNVSSQRAFNTTYTNNTLHPMMLKILCYHSEVEGNYSELVVDGVPIDRSGGHVTSGTLYYRYTLSGIVPPGSTYRVNSQFTKEVWIEYVPRT